MTMETEESNRLFALFLLLKRYPAVKGAQIICCLFLSRAIKRHGSVLRQIYYTIV